MEKFIGVFSMFIKVRTVLMVEFYEVIYAMKEAQKMRLTNIWLECDSSLVCAAFIVRTIFLRCFVIDGILVSITVGKSGLGLLIFFVEGMRVLISWLIYDIFFIENLFIGIIVYS